MGENTFVCGSYQECISNECEVGNGVRLEGVTSGNILKFYLYEVLTALANLQLGCNFSGNRVNTFCFEDDIALMAPTENALEYKLDTLVPKLEKFVS